MLFLQPRDGLRVIESWGPFPIQPLIVRAGVDDALKARVADALLNNSRAARPLAVQVRVVRARHA